MRRVIYSREAMVTLQRVPTNLAGRIRLKVDQYARDAASLANNVERLKGEPGYLRLRIGSWRVVFAEDDIAVEVVRIGPRGDVYE